MVIFVIFFVKFKNECFIGVKNLDMMVVFISNDNVFIVVISYFCGLIKLFIFRVCRFEFEMKIFVVIEDLNMVVVLISNNNIIIFIVVNVLWVIKFIISFIFRVEKMNDWFYVNVILIFDNCNFEWRIVYVLIMYSY